MRPKRTTAAPMAKLSQVTRAIRYWMARHCCSPSTPPPPAISMGASWRFIEIRCQVCSPTITAKPTTLSPRMAQNPCEKSPYPRVKMLTIPVRSTSSIARATTN